MAYNRPMDNDDTLSEFLQILGRIKELVGETTASGDDGIDLETAVKQLREAGNNEAADEITELVQRAEELKALHQPKA